MFQQLPSLGSLSAQTSPLGTLDIKRQPVDAHKRSLPWIAGYLVAGGTLRDLFDMPSTTTKTGVVPPKSAMGKLGAAGLKRLGGIKFDPLGKAIKTGPGIPGMPQPGTQAPKPKGPTPEAPSKGEAPKKDLMQVPPEAIKAAGKGLFGLGTKAHAGAGGAIPGMKAERKVPGVDLKKLGVPLKLAGKYSALAHQHGVGRADIHHRMHEIHSTHAEEVRQHNEMLERARQVMRGETFTEKFGTHGVKGKTIRDPITGKRKTAHLHGFESSGQVPGFTELTEIIASEFFPGRDPERVEQELFAALQGGERDPLTHEQAYEQALAELRQRQEAAAPSPVATPEAREPDEHAEMLKEARRLMQAPEFVKRFGQPRNLEEYEKSAHVPGFEEIAEKIAARYGHILGSNVEEAEQRLLEALKSRPARQPGEEEYEVPGSRRRHPDEEEIPFRREGAAHFEQPGQIDEALWRNCAGVCPNHRPAALPFHLGRIDGNDCWLVDGDYHKIHDDMDFVEGSNSRVAPWVARRFGPDAVVVDANVAAHDWAPILFHECCEARLMRAGMDYERAHARVNPLERIVRLRRFAAVLASLLLLVLAGCLPETSSEPLTLGTVVKASAPAPAPISVPVGGDESYPVAETSPPREEPKRQLDGLLCGTDRHASYMQFWPKGKIVNRLRDDASVLWYDVDNMPRVYQVFDQGAASGVRRADGGQTTANNEFPWRRPVGVPVDSNVVALRFVQVPDGKQIVWWRSVYADGTFARYRWQFPEGTRFGELLLVTDSQGFDHAAELRTRTKTAKGQWNVQVYRPYPREEDFADALASRGFPYTPATPVIRTIDSGHGRDGFRARGLDVPLPQLPESLVNELLDADFEPVKGTTWRGDTAAPTTVSYNIVPTGYFAALVGVDRASCMRCHDSAGQVVNLDGEERWRVRGDGGIFSFHPFDPASVGTTNLRLNPRLVQAGLLAHGGNR